MKIILSNQCESLTGSLGSGFGYHIVKRKNGFFARRDARGKIPRDGYWRFIVACAELAKNGLHIADVQVSWMELIDALYKAGHFVAKYKVRANAIEKGKLVYNAADIINLKITFGL